jgi:hypothetical protein
MKRFLGLANYFRSHVENHSSIAAPLQQLVGDAYTRKSKHQTLQWNAEAEAAFKRLKEAISNSQPLWFENPDLPLHLRTDASQYGIGAILFQLTPEGDEKPIMFISKALTKVQLRWSVPEQEAYAIHFALTKMEYILRDREFTLETDHENLTRIYDGGSPKVFRWHLQLQSFPCKLKFIKGDANVIADALSRVCKNNKDNNTDTNVSALYSIEWAAIQIASISKHI